MRLNNKMEALDEMMFIPYKESIPVSSRTVSWVWIGIAVGVAVLIGWVLSKQVAKGNTYMLPSQESVKLLSYGKLPDNIVLSAKAFQPSKDLNSKDLATAAAKDVKMSLEKYKLEPAVIATVVSLTVNEILSSAMPKPLQRQSTFSVKGLTYPVDEDDVEEEKDEKPQKINADSNQKILAMMKERGL